MDDPLKHLKGVVDRKKEERSRIEAFEAWLYGRQNDIKRAAKYVKTDFWCTTCRRDFEGTGIKQVRVPQGSMWFAYYVGVCPCGRHAIRRITDTLGDPYFYQSTKIRQQQAHYSDDMLAPTHPRFRLLYPTQYSKLFLREQGIVI